MFNSFGMPCLMNNFLGGCSTLATAPNTYCLEGRCHQPPSFPGDHCYTDGECTSGATCENNVCVGIKEGGLCTNQYRLCDRGLYCPNGQPGHMKCRKQVPVGGVCQNEFTLIGLLTGVAGVNECEPGSHCNQNKCTPNEEVKAKEGENCTGRILMGHVERLCEEDLYCHPHRSVCVKWPETLWQDCETDRDCDDPDMVCNCKIGGVKVCEVKGEEGLALYDFLHFASEKVTDCIRQHKCWLGQSSYPRNIFNEHSCAWMNCRKLMADEMHRKYCVDKDLPEHRNCVMENWCKDLLQWAHTEKATPPPATLGPDQMVARLSPAEISAIVVGSLALTLLVFFSGFIVGWIRSKYRAWRSSGSGEGGLANEVEFSNLDSLVQASEEI